MSERNLRIGQKVEIIGKNIRGEVAYVGMTTFAAGKWAGVILNEPKGRNNGTIKGTAYFNCPENYGMFVRPTQLMPLDDAGNPIEEIPEEKPARSRLSSASSVRSVASATKPTAVRRKSPIKTPQTKAVASASSINVTSSNSSSRLSLAGSRQSLAGSRTHLTSSDRSTPLSQSHIEIPRKSERRTTITPPEFSASTSKRESFVETGFLETLKPQFTPGQALTSPAVSSQHLVEEKLNTLQLQQENDELRNQIRDLTEKLETLKQRRNEDKERLRDFDKMKTQFDQMQEFKARIMDAQSQLQRELQRARQETKDAVDARDQHAEEMSELAENVELITLDKEMAEEKADTLQLELEATKERVEELTLDLELIKAEMQKDGAVEINIEGRAGVTSYEFKQLEQQNARLRETLVRLRDLSAHEKHEIQKVTKELETRKSEVAELQRTKEKLSAKIDELEAQLIDLHEQVDAALGADEMVEQLAEKKMELEDKVKLLEEEVAELEALEEVHEQLVESNHELEMDLREELDMAVSAKREIFREKDAALETILDRDQTILKFRELVQKLNDQIQELRDRAASSEAESSAAKQQYSKSTALESIDFKQMFAESKAYTRAIDLQLRQIELSQALEHVRLLTAFMPDTFMNRGGDHDAILVVMLVSRIIFKADIIVGQARERFPAITSIDRNGILQGHEVQQFSFKSRLLHHVHNLKGVMYQFLYGLSACSPDMLLKAGASLPEMLAQEKIIDSVVELLKANQLDENSPTENLEKSIVFFNAMYSVLLGSGEGKLLNETQFVRDCVSSIQSACEAIGTDCAIVQALIQGGDETAESGLLLQYVLQTSETIRQQLKLIKRRLPQDAAISKCNLSAQRINTLRQTSEQLGKVMTTLFVASKLILQTIAATAAEGSQDVVAVSVSDGKLMELLGVACEKIYEQDDRGPSQNFKAALATINTDMAQLAQFLLDNEYEIMSVVTTTAAQAEKPRPPITLRAQAVKKQMEETKALTATVENKEAEIKQLKLAAKVKAQEYSEMNVRKEMAEKKLSVLQQELEKTTDGLQRKYDETLSLLKKKEKEFEETMDHLQNDIDSLESERGALRDKLKTYSNKKGDLKATTAFDITASSPYIAQELTLLKKALNDERTERMKLQAADMSKILSNLTPIHVPQPKDNRISELEKEIVRVKHDYIMSLAKGSEFPQSKTAHPNIPKLLRDHQNKQMQLRQDIKSRVEILASEVMNEYLQRKPHRAAKGDFAQFPSVELSRVLRT